MSAKENLNFYPELNLRDVIDMNAWQKVQDNFSAVTEVSLLTVDSKGNFLTKPSLETRLCSQVLRNSPQRDKICGSCLPTFLGGKGVVDRNLTFYCETAGLHNFVAPLKTDDGKVLGYVILGPVILVMRKTKEEYRKAAEELNINLEDFWSAILEIKVVSFQGMQSLVELIKDVGEFAIGLTYKNIMKEGIAIDLSKLKLKRLFEILLEVAFEISGADIGSIMLLDKASGSFAIRVSKGIPEEIALNTRMKPGEGISGIVAKEGEPMLVDNSIKDNRIRRFLHRPNISSSMVLPLKSEEQVVGIMNLAALETSPIKFNKANLNLMNRLLDLASIAIQ